jgi:hypothetical protein
MRCSATAERRGRHVLLATLSAVALLLCCANANAGRSTIAEQLFREGRTLIERGDIAAACESFAASMRAERSVGAYVNLARCHELQSKSATAHREYLEAARFAESEGQPGRAEAARRLAAALEEKISTLTIAITEPVDGLRVLRDGRLIAPETIGAPAHVDPGTYRVEASAPGYAAWSRVVRVGPDGDARRVEIPPLTHNDANGAPDVAPGEPGSIAQPIGWTLTALGAGAALAGLIVGITVLTDADDAASDPALCPDNNCTAEGNAFLSELDDRALAANVLIPIGLTMAAVGVVVLVVSPDDKEPSSSAHPTSVELQLHASGAVLRGSFW